MEICPNCKESKSIIYGTGKLKCKCQIAYLENIKSSLRIADEMVNDMLGIKENQ